MTLRHLEIFLTVSRSLSMTKAAEELNMSQPAVSKAISELEAYYHTVLFDRIRKKLYLTDSGERLRQYADTILSQFEESVTALRDGSVFQTVRMAVNLTVGETRLSEICGLIEKKFPETDLHVDICNSHQIEMMLKNNECDFAIMDEREDPALSTTKLYTEFLKPIAAKKYCPKERLKETELLSYRLLLREKGSGNRNCIEPYLKSISFPESSVWSACSDEVLLKMAAEGEGIAFLPASYLSNHKNRDIQEIQIAGWKLQRIFYLVTRKERYLNHAVQQCMKYIADAL